MYFVYILYSERSDRYYIGHTADLAARLHEHNAGRVRSTKGYRPWNIMYQEVFDTKQNAFRRERQIKSYKHGEVFQKLIEHSEGC